MTILSTTNRINYTSVGEASFAYPFLILVDTDLQYYDNGVLKVLGVDYTIPPAGVGSPTGGNVVLTVPSIAGHSIVIIRVEPFTQESDLPSNDKFPSNTVETALDKLTMLVQQLNEVDQRTLRLSITSLFSNLTLPDPAVGKYLRWASLAALENADITTVGSLGLPVSSANGGTGLSVVGNEGEQLTSVAGAIAYKPAGLVRMTNKSGAQRLAGDVVIPSTANDQAVSTTTAVGSSSPVFVVQETINDNATGYLQQRGVVAAIKVQGNVARYDFLRTSATAGRAESAGASKGTGAFAMALSVYGGGAAGTVIAILFGDTYVAASLPAFGDTPPRDNLLIVYASASTLTITADGVKMLDGSGVSRVKRTLSVTADITTTGLNGRDTVTAEAGTKWYWIWAVSNGATDGILLVPDSGGGTPNAPSSSIYTVTYKLLIGAVFNDGSSNFRPFRQRNLRIDYTGDTTNGAPTVFTAKTGVVAFTAESIAAFIPPSWVAVVRGLGGTSTLTNPSGFYVSPNAAGEYQHMVQFYGNSLTTVENWIAVGPWEIQWISGINIYWRTPTAAVTSFRMGIRGFDLIS